MKRYDQPDPRLAAPCADWVKRPMRAGNHRSWELSRVWDETNFELAGSTWGCDALLYMTFGGAI